MNVNNGMIDPESIKDQAAESDDIVLKDLYTIASDSKIVEMSVSNDQFMKNSDGKNVNIPFGTNPYNFDIREFKGTPSYDQLKAEGEIDGKTIQGNTGRSLFPVPDDLGNQSTNGNIQIQINQAGNLAQRAVGVAHEFGHVVLFLNNQPYQHWKGNVEQEINKRTRIVKKRLGYDY